MRISPFIVAMTGAILALVADVAWLAGELLVQFGLMSMKVYIGLRVGILLALVIGIILALWAVYKYFNNGYVRADKIAEINHLKEKCKSKGRRKIFCGK